MAAGCRTSCSKVPGPRRRGRNEGSPLNAAALLLAVAALAAHAPEDERDFGRAAELRVTKQSAAALELLGAIEARSGQRPETLAEAAYQRGLLLEALGRSAEALAAYERVEAAGSGAPATAHARLSRARLLVRTGRTEDAAAAYAGLQWAPPAVASAALLERAGLAESQGRRLVALAAWRDLLRSFPGSAEAGSARAALDAACARLMAAPASATLVDDALARGDCLLDRERGAEAVAAYRKVLARARVPEERAELWAALGRAYDLMENAGAAEDAWRKAVKALPGTPQAAAAQMAIVQSRLDRGRLAEAVRELEKVVKAYPGTPVAAQAQYMAATCWEGLRNRVKAEEAYRAVLALAPQSVWGVEAQQSLVRLLEQAP